jgi:hypothetical protein
MKTKPATQTGSPNLTIADLCEALADGRLAARRDEEFYTIRSNDLRRWAEMTQITTIQPAPSMIDRFVAAG